MSYPGCYSGTKEADRGVQETYDEVRFQVQKITEKRYRLFTALQYRDQVSEGKNFLIKVHVGEGVYIHIMVHQNLSGKRTVTNVEENHTKEDPLFIF
ncbi:cystatin-A-like [Halichoeres trimaculatus]|uniref:cystatin-A-like n=1 Tax=Halichoeres trimaculatus TaxID=147232 RepID=UPI003D9E56F7